MKPVPPALPLRRPMAAENKMQTNQLLQGRDAVEGAAFPRAVKMLASLLIAALVFWGVQAFGQMRGAGWSSAAAGFMGVTLCVIGLCYYWILRSRTAIDEGSIRQSWLWPKQVALADISQAKFIYVPYLQWLIAPRLIVRARGRGLFVFHAADPRVLQRFAHLSLGVVAAVVPVPPKNQGI